MMKQIRPISFLIHILLWGFVIICLWQGMLFFKNLTQLDNTPPLTTKLPRYQSPQYNDTDVASISQLFQKGQLTDNTNPKPQVVKKVVIFPNIKLQGTIVNSNPNKSLAIITQDGKQSMLGISETIAKSQATIYQILDESIVLLQEGQKKTINLAIPPHKNISQPVYETTSSSSLSSNLSDSPPPPAPPKEVNDIKDFREQLANNPSTIAHYVSFNPVFTNKKITGYRLSPRGDNQIFSQLGLKYNDLAYAISGADFYVDLSDKKALTSLWGKIQQIDSFTLHLKRDEQNHEVVIPLK